MIKRFYISTAFILASFICIGFISCNKGNDSLLDQDSSSSSKTSRFATNRLMSSNSQKEYLEQVALEVMDLMPASDFKSQADLANFIRKNYGKNYEWKSVGDWLKDIFDVSIVSLNLQTTETDNKGNTIQEYFYNNYKSLIFASNFVGHFTAQNGRWTMEEAEDLQFVFPDQYGRTCVINLQTSGENKKVHAFDLLKRYDYKQLTVANHYISYYYYDLTQCIVNVPEKIIISLTQGEEKIVESTLQIELSDITSEEFDISKEDLTFSFTTNLNNGYQFNISQLLYKASKDVSLSFSFNKGDKQILTLGLSSDLKGIPSVNVDAFSRIEINKYNYDLTKANASDAYVKADIIGKVQIQGVVYDVRNYIENYDQANNSTVEDKHKKYVNAANLLSDINLFYDGNDVKQAVAKLESFTKENWNGVTWKAEPVIQFLDGSSYSTFTAFFNEEDFNHTIDSFKALADRYADIMERRINW